MNTLAQQALDVSHTVYVSTGTPSWMTLAFVILVVVVVAFVLAGFRGRRCRYCRKRNRSEAVFCAECGHRLDERPEPS